MSVLSASGPHLPSCSARARPGSVRVHGGHKRVFVLRRACCGGKRRQHHSQTAKKSSESGLRPPRSEMAPSGRLLPTAGRARARPHLAACAPGRLEQAAHGEKPPPRCGKSSGPSPGPKPRPSWLWRGSGCERPSSTAGGARQQAVGRCLPPPPRTADQNTARGSPPGRAPSLVVSTGVPSPSPALAAVQPHAPCDSVLVPILSPVL